MIGTSKVLENNATDAHWYRRCQQQNQCNGQNYHQSLGNIWPLPSDHYLLVVVDYYSRYMEIEVMGKKIDSTETISRLRPIARFGLLVSITADNGSQLVSEEFKSFCIMNNIKLISTISYWPQQNGEVERQNRSIVKRLKISQSTNRNWKKNLQNLLLMY